MHLCEIQEHFKNLMLDQPGALDNPDRNFSACIEENNIPVSERLKIYRNNIVGSITDNLAATFPLLEKLVGEEFLKLMVRSFILNHPPQSGCLNLYGKGFPEFIDNNFEALKSMPYISDMARLELLMNDAYYALEYETISIEDLSSIPAENLADINLKLGNSAGLLASKYPLTEIRELCINPENDPPDMNNNPQFLLIIRAGLEVHIVSLTQDEFKMLQLIKQGKTLGQALETVLEQSPDFDITNFIGKHINIGTFAKPERP